MRQHNQIGDMLCSLTLYLALKKKYPEALITLVAAKTNYEIPFFDINPYLDRVIIFDKSSLKTIIRFIKTLRDRKYQIGVVPSTIVLSRTSHIINLLSGAKYRIGVKSIDSNENNSHKYLNIKSDFFWKGKHQSIRNLEVIEQINCHLTKEEIDSIRMNLSGADVSFAKDFLSSTIPDKKRKIIAIHPGAGKEINIWAAKNFIELVKKLNNNYSIYILITSGWTDDRIVKPICTSLQDEKIEYTILNNLPVKKLGAILSLVDLYITNDTGTMHIAGYSNAKMISLFGPTNPNEWASTGNNQKYIKSADSNINNITVNEVFLLAETFLSNTKS